MRSFLCIIVCLVLLLSTFEGSISQDDSLWSHLLACLLLTKHLDSVSSNHAQRRAWYQHLMSALGRLPVLVTHRMCSKMTAALCPDGLTGAGRLHNSLTSMSRHVSMARTGVGWQSGTLHTSCSPAPGVCPAVASAAVRAAMCSGTWAARFGFQESKWRDTGAAATALPLSVARRPHAAMTRASHLATAGLVANAVAEEAPPPQRRGFRPAPDLVECLRRFNGLRSATLHDFTDVQTQLHMGKNKVQGAHAIKLPSWLLSMSGAYSEGAHCLNYAKPVTDIYRRHTGYHGRQLMAGWHLCNCRR